MQEVMRAPEEHGEWPVDPSRTVGLSRSRQQGTLAGPQAGTWRVAGSVFIYLQVLIIHPCLWENRLPWRDVGREVGARCGESIHHLLLRIQTQGEIFIW